MYILKYTYPRSNNYFVLTTVQVVNEEGTMPLNNNNDNYQNNSSPILFFNGTTSIVQPLYSDNIGHFIFDYAYLSFHNAMLFGYEGGRVDRVFALLPEKEQHNKKWGNAFINPFTRDVLDRNSFPKVRRYKCLYI